MGWAIFQEGIWGVTTRLNLVFRRPALVDEELRIIGQVARDRGRAFELRGEIRRAEDDSLVASAEAIYVRMSEARRREHIEKYGDPAPALAQLRRSPERDGTAVDDGALREGSR
jgi:hypothetical protein